MLYILQFSEPLGSDKHKAYLYLGYCADNRLEECLEEHRQGFGAKINKAAVERGAELILIATHKGTRKDERRYKNWKSHQLVLKAWLKEKRGKQ